MVICRESQASAKLVGGQLHSWMMTRRWGQCMGCTVLLDAELEVQRKKKGHV